MSMSRMFALVTLILGLFVLRPILSRPPVTPAPALAAPSRLGATRSAMSADSALEPLTGVIDDDDADLPDLAVVGDGEGTMRKKAVGFDRDGGNAPADPAERLRNLIGERQDETVEILRSWLETREENA